MLQAIAERRTWPKFGMSRNDKPGTVFRNYTNESLWNFMADLNSEYGMITPVSDPAVKGTVA